MITHSQRWLAPITLAITILFATLPFAGAQPGGGSEKRVVQAATLQATGNRIPIFEHIPVYGIYRYPTVQDQLPPGVIRLSNPAVTRLVNLSKALKNYRGGLQLVLELHAEQDAYDRLGFVYFSDQMPVADGPDQSLLTNRGLEAMRFITPFFLASSTPNQYRYVSQVSDITDVLPLLSRSQWISVQIDNNPEYRVTGQPGFSFSLYAVKTDMPAPYTYLQNLFKTSITSPTYTSTFTTERNLTDARINIFTSGHGSASGGEEYAHRLHNVYLDGDLESVIDTKKDCAPYRQDSPLGNPGIFIGNNTYNPRNWCPGEVLPHNYIDLGSLPAGQHTITVEVPQADFGSPGDYIMISAYLVGN